MTHAPITWDRFGMRAHAERLKDAMNDVLNNTPHEVSGFYAHRMVCTDVLVSPLTGAYTLRIEGAALDTRALNHFLMAEMHRKGFKDNIAVDLHA